MMRISGDDFRGVAAAVSGFAHNTLEGIRKRCDRLCHTLMNIVAGTRDVAGVTGDIYQSLRHPIGTT